MNTSSHLPNDNLQRVQSHFAEHRQLLDVCAKQLAAPILQAGELLTQCILQGTKVLVCGSASSATSAMHFAASMVGRFELERPGLPVVALSADSAVLNSLGNDYAFDTVFARQVHAFGAAGDVLLAISAQANCAAIDAAVRAAQAHEMRVIVLTGQHASGLNGLLRAGDIEVCVPHERNIRVLELHQMALHMMSDIVDFSLLGG